MSTSSLLLKTELVRVKRDLIDEALKCDGIDLEVISKINNMNDEELMLLLLKSVNFVDATEYMLSQVMLDHDKEKEKDDLPF